MKFTKWFWISFAVMVVLFFLPTFLTYNAPAVDGSRVYGFPLTYYSWGGLCYSPDGGRLCSSFSTFNLIIDIIIILVIPFIVNFSIIKIKK